MNSKSELQGIISNSIRYWEVRRILYNLILLGVMVFIIDINWRDFPIGETSPNGLDFWTIIELFPLVALVKSAIIANILYCSAYIVDIFIQISDYHHKWLKSRWLLFLAGTVFASILAAYYTIVLFE